MLNLPTGSPIPSSHIYSKSNDFSQSIKSTRKSSEMQYVGNFGFRIVSERHSMIDNPKNISKKSNYSTDTNTNNNAENNFNFSENEASLNDDFINNNESNNYSNSVNNNSIHQNTQDIMSSSDSDDMIELVDFNNTPSQKKQKSIKSPRFLQTPNTPINQFDKSNVINKDQTTIPIIKTIGSKNSAQSANIGRIVKKAAVSSLAKLSNQAQTKVFYNNVTTNFFQAFDKWNRQKEKEHQIKIEEAEKKKKLEIQKDFNAYDQSLAGQLQMAERKMEDLRQEEEKWKIEYQKSKVNQNNSSNSNENSMNFFSFNNFDDTTKPSKVNYDYDFGLTKQLVIQFDQLDVKIQTDYSVTSEIDEMAKDISAKMFDLSKSNIISNIDQLLH